MNSICELCNYGTMTTGMRKSCIRIPINQNAFLKYVTNKVRGKKGIYGPY